jgi:hypothetical protein
MQSARETGATSLPSWERKGVQPYEHHGGVGPLPGTSSETSVAKLPDERAAAAAAAASAAAAAGTESPKPARDTVAPRHAPSAEQKILSLETGDQNIVPLHPPLAQQAPERVEQEPDVGVSDSSCRVFGYVFLAKGEYRKLAQIRS